MNRTKGWTIPSLILGFIQDQGLAHGRSQDQGQDQGQDQDHLVIEEGGEIIGEPDILPAQMMNQKALLDWTREEEAQSTWRAKGTRKWRGRASE